MGRGSVRFGCSRRRETVAQIVRRVVRSLAPYHRRGSRRGMPRARDVWTFLAQENKGKKRFWKPCLRTISRHLTCINRDLQAARQTKPVTPNEADSRVPAWSLRQLR